MIEVDDVKCTAKQKAAVIMDRLIKVQPEELFASEYENLTDHERAEVDRQVMIYFRRFKKILEPTLNKADI